MPSAPARRPRPARPGRDRGLPALRRGGTLGDLLFLFDCTTSESTRLRPIAGRLGVTVQAASHTYRQLARRGLIEVRGGRYLPTVTGVAWLHRTLGELADDVFTRQQRLKIVRSLRAVAAVDLRAGEAVRLDLVDGLLTARPGRSEGSRGRVAESTPAGSLALVEELEGILELPPAEVVVLTVPSERVSDAELIPALRREIAERRGVLVGAMGLEAIHLAQRAGAGGLQRFATAAAAADAARVGVSSTLLVLDEDLSRLLSELDAAGRPRITVRPVASRGGGRR